MLRYLIDQVLIKAFDFFYEPPQEAPAQTESSAADLHFISRAAKRKPITNLKPISEESAVFVDQLMVDLNNNTEDGGGVRPSFARDDDDSSANDSSSNFLIFDSSLRNSLHPSIDTYYDEINREFNFENLDKFYSTDTKFKKRYFKMLTSYDKEEFLYTYLDNDRDSELVQTLKSNITRAVKVFQKPYYIASTKEETNISHTWRLRERMKTLSAVLVVCLNVSTEPPGITKGTEWSKIECWINHSSLNPQFAIKKIGSELQKQYERWQPKALIKQCLDPTIEDVKRACISLRKAAKDGRVLFHYNGHGVPPPTMNGQIWVFNSGMTEYVTIWPHSILNWMGAPSLFVWDCSNAGMIVQTLVQIETEKYLSEAISSNGETVENTTTETASSTASKSSLTDDGSTAEAPTRHESIHLAACRANESLPIHPELPLDLFTACLTTPIKAALSWHIVRKTTDQRRFMNISLDLAAEIPGSNNDRRTMLGELNWIFTAITDTIAWNVLDTKTFHGLFRQDLLVASLSRNFLLARRIMKSFEVNAVSHPPLPETNKHSLWQAWDLTLDMCLEQLPGIIHENKEYIPCGFFAEQIELFDVWLKYNVEGTNLPEQLPILLQVLLNQQFRMRALGLLRKFLDLGTWAVSAALSVGIFPYILKLLTSQPELGPELTFIYAKILAVDRSCQIELINEKAHMCFIHVLADPEVESTDKVFAAFVLASLVDSYPTGQAMAMQNHLIGTCTFLVTDKKSKGYRNQYLRQWCCICLGLSWQYFPQAKWEAMINNAHQVLIELLFDSVPEVRAAAVFALGTFISCEGGPAETPAELDVEIASILIREHEMAFVVRKEVIIALYHFMYKVMIQSDPTSAQEEEQAADESSPGQSNAFNNQNISVDSSGDKAAFMFKSPPRIYTNGFSSENPLGNESARMFRQFSSTSSSPVPSFETRPLQVFAKVFKLLVDLQSDPFTDVAALAQRVVAYFYERSHNFDTHQQNLIQLVMSRDSKEIRLIPDFSETKSQSSSSLNELESMKLPTDFVNSSRNFFSMPFLAQRIQPSALDSDIDIYSTDFLNQHCKVLYNHKVNRRPPSAWQEPQHMDELFQIKHNSAPVHCRFHPFDDQILVVDKDAFITVYDIPVQSTRKNLQRLRFSNDSHLAERAKSKNDLITSFKLINAQHEPMVLTGTNDCIVRIFKPDLMNYEGHTLLTAFRAFSSHERKPSSIEAGLVAEWSDRNEMLLCAGDCTIIRVWDMNKELYKDHQTLATSCVSSLTFQENLAVAGFGDGSVKVFDFRRPSTHGSHRTNPVLKPPMVASQPSLIHQHNAMVSRVYLHPNSQKLVTASVLGDINVFDTRNMKSLLSSSFNNEPSWVIECHPVNQLVATANQSQSIKIYDLNGNELSVIKHHEGFIGKKISGVSCLDWNYFKNELAFGSIDNTISIFTNKHN